MESFKQEAKKNIQENLRDKIESSTGVIGQTLRDRREKIEQERQITTEVAEIKKRTDKLSLTGSTLDKINISFVQISENLQIINKWADAQVTTHEETAQSMAEVKQEQAKPQPVLTPPKDSKEEESLFDKMLGMLGNIKKLLPGKKPPRKPKGPKGGKGKFGKGKAALIIAGTAVAGYGLFKLLGNNDKMKDLPKEEAEPPTPAPQQQEVDYKVTPTVTTPPPTTIPPVAAPPLPKPEPIVPPAPKPITPTPIAAPKPAAAAPAPAPAVPATPVPSTAPPNAAAAPAQESVNLSSVTKLADPSVSLAGISPSLAQRVGAMALAFKQQTGKTLLVTSGVRSNEKQKELYDAKLAQLGGDKAATRKLVAEPAAPLGGGKGSAHLIGQAIDINSKGDTGINTLAGSRDTPTGWLEKFGLTRPVPKEDWHIQLSGTPPAGDQGGVPGKDGKPVDPSSGKAQPLPTDPKTGQQLIDTKKTVDQLKQENAKPKETVVVVRNSKETTTYDRKQENPIRVSTAIS